MARKGNAEIWHFSGTNMISATDFCQCNGDTDATLKQAPCLACACRRVRAKVLAPQAPPLVDSTGLHRFPAPKTKTPASAGVVVSYPPGFWPGTSESLFAVVFGGG